ncbi:MAG: CBS domain-containing protein, partial [Verrucomicrobiota bacterium]
LRLEILSCHDPTTKLATLVRPLPLLSEMHTVKAAYLELLSNRHHMAEVVDEYGEFAGLVTFEDIVETILGAEIVDEMDTHVDLREAARRRLAADSAPAATS